MIYHFADSALPFDPNSYQIPSLVINVVFQSGELNGRDFEVNFNSATHEFEIINQYPEGFDQLPGGPLVPTAGDEYILYNLRMPSEYYALAEQEFADAVSEYMQKHNLDKSIYQGDTDYVYVQKENLSLRVGQRIRLESDQYFPNGYRISRITAISQKVNNPAQMTVSFSDVIAKGVIATIEESIDSVMTFARANTLPGIIKTWQSTEPTDYNLFSALRVLRECISKKVNDTAAGLIRFAAGAEFGDYRPAQSGAGIDQAGNSEFLTTVIRNMLRSPVFIDGFFGEGFGLWKDESGVAHLTVDKLLVRQTMSVMELLVNKVRSVGGQIVVSAANGKISEVEQVGDNYIISFEDENMFVAGDLVRCSVFTGNELKSYWVEVSETDGNSITVSVSEFGDQVPAAGDECVLMGNTINTLRQNLISISATEDGQPRIDVLNGVHDKNFTGCLRARLGNLDGIYDSWFPADNQPHGDGLYADNAYLRGTFLLVTGEDVLTKFQITEGLIQSSIESIRQDFLEDKGFLSNPMFWNGFEKWDTGVAGTTSYFAAGGKWLYFNGGLYGTRGDHAEIRIDNGRNVVFFNNTFIKQYNANLHGKPEFSTNADGLKEPCPVFLTFFYRCQSEGTLNVAFESVNKAGFINFSSMQIEQNLTATDGYKQFVASGLWNGSGDFKLSFTGEIYIYMVILSTDRVEALKYQYRTLFEQSDKLIKIAATNFDINGNPLQSSQIVTKADMNLLTSNLYGEDGNLVEGAGLITKSNMAGMFAIDSEGNIASFVGASSEGVKIRAANITLEGLVTANENFKILTDGSIQAKNAEITGTFSSNLSGKKVVIDPSADSKIKYIDGNNNTIASLAFYDDQVSYPGNPIIYGILNLARYDSGNLSKLLSIDPHTGIKLTDYVAGKVYKVDFVEL
jgi:hypothetical protein